MCDATIIHDLQNGKGEDMRTQSRAIAQLMEASNDTKTALKEVRDKLVQIPTRTEVREIVQENLSIHIQSCDAARDGKPAESNKFKLGAGKLGVEAEGRAGVFITAVFWLTVGAVLFVAIPRIAEWIGAWAAKGGTP